MVVRAKMMVVKGVVEKAIAVTRAMVVELAVVAAREKTGAIIMVTLVMVVGARVVELAMVEIM